MFALFAGWHYYPAGGWRDLVGVYSTVEDAQMARNTDDYEWYQIVDLSGAVVVEGG